MSKSHTSLLDHLKIASPCSESWDSMRGDDEVRFCSHCDLSVHNLSEMTRAKAMALVRRSQGRLCVRYYRQPDGTIQTATPPLHHIKRRVSRIAAGAFTATLSLCASVAAQTTATTDSSTSNNVQIVSQQDSVRPDNQDGSGGALAGTVTDPNGGVIPAAKVTLVDEKTNREQSATTNDEGAFRFQSLPAGDYTLKVEGTPGFATSQTTGINLSPGEERRVDTSLEPMGALTGVVYIVPEPANALVKAAADDDLAAARELIATGADVNVVDEDVNFTALMKAVGNGNWEMVRLLLDAGAEVNAKNRGGVTALMALGERTDAEIVWTLVSAGARVNRKDEKRNTALIWAARIENAPVLQALLDAGAKVNAKNKEGKTALMMAVDAGYLENVKALLTAGADVNQRNEDDETALSLARDNEQSEIIQLLEAYGARE